jgi:hypothetical protein
MRYRGMDEDQLYVDQPPFRPRSATDMVPAESFVERLDRLPTRVEMWRAALLGALAGAGLVIIWIELVHQVCL